MVKGDGLGGEGWGDDDDEEDEDLRSEFEEGFGGSSKDADVQVCVYDLEPCLIP